MRTNRHPADELADIRGRIRALKAREAELRGVLLSDVGQLTGAENRVIVHRYRRRVFRKDRLPPEVLSDPAFWEETEATRVVIEPCAKAGQAPGAVGRPGDPAMGRRRGPAGRGRWHVDDDVLFRRVTGCWPDG